MAGGSCVLSTILLQEWQNDLCHVIDESPVKTLPLNFSMSGHFSLIVCAISKIAILEQDSHPQLKSWRQARICLSERSCKAGS